MAKKIIEQKATVELNFDQACQIAWLVVAERLELQSWSDESFSEDVSQLQQVEEQLTKAFDVLLPNLGGKVHMTAVENSIRLRQGVK